MTANRVDLGASSRDNGTKSRGNPKIAGTGKRWWRGYLPPQHGAWAMLLVPYVAGVALAGPRWVQLPLLVAWLGGYLLSYYVFQAVKTRRPHRVRRQLLGYAGLTAPAAVLVLAVHPEVLAFAPGYAALLAVNAWYAWRRRERALANDLASVAQSCLMVFVVTVPAGVPLDRAAIAFGLVLAYFVGTVLYVKTMIRERGNLAYRRLSIGYHLLALAAVGWLSVPVAVLFSALAARAWVLSGRALSAKRVGMIEIGFSVALVLVAATTR